MGVSQMNGNDHQPPTSRQQAQAIVSHVRELESQGFGAGSVYELYEERRIAEIRSLLTGSSLSEEDHDWVCRVLNYNPDGDGIYAGRCEKCGVKTDAETMAQSLVHTGEELCRKCLVEAVV